MEENTLFIELTRLAVHSAVSIAVLYVLFHFVTKTLPEMLERLAATWTAALQHQTSIFTTTVQEQTKAHGEMTAHQISLQQALVQNIGQQMLHLTQVITSLEKQVEINGKNIESWRPSHGRRKEDTGP